MARFKPPAQSPVERVRAAHPGASPRVATAPGTWVLIGENVDHFGGVTLAGTASLRAAAAVSPRRDGLLSFTARGPLGQELVAQTPYDDAPAAGLERRWWGLVHTLVQRQVLSRDTAGLDVTVESDVPVGAGLGALRLVARGIDPGVVRPVGVGTRDLASDAAKQSMVLAVFLPYLLLLSGFLGGIYLIVDATAGERERQSLEPLLATPAARGAIVSGKMAAGCVIGITSLLLTLLALKGSSMMGDTARMLDVRWLAIGKLLLILLPMVVIGTALFTFLAAAAKSVKEAQSHMSWLMLLPMVPSFVLMVNPIKTEGWQFAVPFLAQNQMILKVIRAEPIDPATWGMYLAAALALAAVLWLAAVHRYGQERLAVSG